MSFEKRLHDYIHDPEHPVKNYWLGREYEDMGQTAAAFSFMLRCAERTVMKELQYECLIRLGTYFSSQGNRMSSVKNMYQAAITVMPDRPEAYYYLSKVLENQQQYFESYMMAEIGLNVLKDDQIKLAIYFPGKYVLIFQKAVAAWWRGRGKESRQLFQYLVDNHWEEMDDIHKGAVERNILTLGSNPPSYIYRMYKREMYPNMRYRFPGSQIIRENFSQVYQDIFVLSMLNGKRYGTFLEVGGAGPHKGNNTWLLERDFHWKGVSIEYDPAFAAEYRKARKNTLVIEKDALKLDYDALIKEHFKSNVIDYLQLDIEPAGNTYECLLRIPFDKYQFRVITYEHDYYADLSRKYRDLSRKYLESKGYVLVVNDISPDGVNTFEDWWVHPDHIDPNILEHMRGGAVGATDATEYMFPKNAKLMPEIFDWGAINKNAWFRDMCETENFVDDVYQKFVSVKNGDVVLDIGASVGPFGWKIRDRKLSKIVFVEPHPQLMEKLCENISKTQLINQSVFIDKAIGYHNGTEKIKGLFNPDIKETHDDVDNEVEVISFKTLIDENKIDHVDFLKIDCEGGEYDIFTDDNMEWIKKNVRYIAGEFHLSTPELKAKFRYFRDKHLTQFANYNVLSVDYVDIAPTLFDDWFIDRYETINIYIDNRKKVHTVIDNTAPKEKKYIKDKWKYSISPTLEFTTSIPEKGCVVDCVFCPQKTLLKTYKGERRLSLENFKMVVDKLPKEIRVTFSGFTEPWLNSDCTEMVLYAHEKGHPVSVFTTLVGVSVDDLERIKHIPWAGNPNGGFTVHLPDQERRAKHPITKKYIETAKWFAENMGTFKNASLMSMGTVHESVAEYYRGYIVHQNDMWDRAGNLKGEALLKEELNKEKFRSVAPPEPGVQYTCGCDERLYHNIVLPNGDVSLCCMDYGLEEITGNIFTSEYNDVIPDPYEVFKMCARCENRIDVNSRFIQAERKSFNV